MRIQIFLVCLLVQALNAVEVVDESRKCPDGYSYYGEVAVTDFPRDYMVEGGRTPTYSCYQLITGALNWVQANQKCSEADGEVVSVNNYGERSVLSGQMALDVLPTSESILTSGISLGPDSWTWFGAGENITDTELLSELPPENSTNTQCLLLSWRTSENDTELFYSSQDCLAPASNILCEVRVYTQTWYYWAGANWLQILFCLTLVLLVLSTCVTISMYGTSPRSRRSRGSSADLTTTLPPPYTVHDNSNINSTTKAANKYAEKGKELLAKVVFYRKSEDKQKLTMDA